MSEVHLGQSDLQELTVTPAHRQEVPLHRQRLHPRPNLDWCRKVHQDEPNHHHPTGLPALHPQVQAIRETTQELGRPLLARFPS